MLVSLAVLSHAIRSVLGDDTEEPSSGKNKEKKKGKEKQLWFADLPVG